MKVISVTTAMLNVHKGHSSWQEQEIFTATFLEHLGENRNLPLPSQKTNLLIYGSQSYQGKDEHHFHQLAAQHNERRANVGYPGQGILCGRFLTNVAQVPARRWSPGVCDLGDTQASFGNGGMPFRLEIPRHVR